MHAYILSASIFTSTCMPTYLVPLHIASSNGTMWRKIGCFDYSASVSAYKAHAYMRLCMHACVCAMAICCDRQKKNWLFHLLRKCLCVQSSSDRIYREHVIIWRLIHLFGTRKQAFEVRIGVCHTRWYTYVLELRLWARIHVSFPYIRTARAMCVRVCVCVHMSCEQEHMHISLQ